MGEFSQSIFQFIYPYSYLISMISKPSTWLVLKEKKTTTTKTTVDREVHVSPSHFRFKAYASSVVLVKSSNHYKTNYNPFKLSYI